MFQTFSPIQPVCVQYVHWVFSRYLHVKVDWNIIKWRVFPKDQNFNRPRLYVQDNFCSYTHSVRQYSPSYYGGSELVKDPHLNFINDQTWMFQTLSPTPPVYVHDVYWVLSGYLHVKVGWNIIKWRGPKLERAMVMYSRSFLFVYTFCSTVFTFVLWWWWID